MGRDLFDADLLTLLDQAASVAVQLQVQGPAREALASIGLSPDALADQCLADRLAGRDAWADVENAARARRALTLRGAELLPQLATWWRRCAAGLDLALAAAPVTVAPALRRLRALVPMRKERLTPMHVALRSLVDGLRTNSAAVDFAPHLPAILAAGEALLAEADAWEAEGVAADDHFAAASQQKLLARARIIETLRHVRACWQTASLAVTFGVPPLDLREVAGRTRRRSRPAPADTVLMPPSVPEEAGGPLAGCAEVPADGPGVLVEAPDSRAVATVVVRVEASARGEEGG